MTPAELKAGRLERGLTQRELGEALGVGGRTGISKRECGEYAITPAFAGKVQQVFAAFPPLSSPYRTVIDRRESNKAQSHRTLVLCPDRIAAVRRLAAMDPREADPCTRRLARLLSKMICRADLVIANAEIDVVGFLDAASRIERVARAG